MLVRLQRISVITARYINLTRSLSTISDSLRQNFSVRKDFFTIEEQRLLLCASLYLLDSNESRKYRRFRESRKLLTRDALDIQELFFPDSYYNFEQGHYDGVIHNFREMHVTSWPEAQFPGIVQVLERLRSLCPTPDIQTHILHLASDGQILPHVDNIEASGSWILGASLGSTRVMRLENQEKKEIVDIILPSGSVYIQRNDIRYQYKHSILESQLLPLESTNQQRLSIMIRDRFKPPFV